MEGLPVSEGVLAPPSGVECECVGGRVRLWWTVADGGMRARLSDRLVVAHVRESRAGHVGLVLTEARRGDGEAWIDVPGLREGDRLHVYPFFASADMSDFSRGTHACAEAAGVAVGGGAGAAAWAGEGGLAPAARMAEVAVAGPERGGVAAVAGGVGFAGNGGAAEGVVALEDAAGVDAAAGKGVAAAGFAAEAGSGALDSKEYVIGVAGVSAAEREGVAVVADGAGRVGFAGNDGAVEGVAALADGAGVDAAAGFAAVTGSGPLDSKEYIIGEAGNAAAAAGVELVARESARGAGLAAEEAAEGVGLAVEGAAKEGVAEVAAAGLAVAAEGVGAEEEAGAVLKVAALVEGDGDAAVAEDAGLAADDAAEGVGLAAEEAAVDAGLAGLEAARDAGLAAGEEAKRGVAAAAGGDAWDGLAGLVGVGGEAAAEGVRLWWPLAAPNAATANGWRVNGWGAGPGLSGADGLSGLYASLGWDAFGGGGSFAWVRPLGNEWWLKPEGLAWPGGDYGWPWATNPGLTLPGAEVPGAGGGKVLAAGWDLPRPFPWLPETGGGWPGATDWRQPLTGPLAGTGGWATIFAADGDKVSPLPAGEGKEPHGGAK